MHTGTCNVFFSCFSRSPDAKTPQTKSSRPSSLSKKANSSIGGRNIENGGSLNAKGDIGGSSSVNRRLNLSEDDATVTIDAGTFRQMLQEQNTVKTMLLTLQRVLQDVSEDLNYVLP